MSTNIISNPISKPLKIAFAGTPEIAKIVLEHLLNSGFDVSLVLTQPDRPRGRGNKVSGSPVKQLALARGIDNVLQPVSFKHDAQQSLDVIRALNPDIIIVVAYGLILPLELLTIPRLGCVNIHVSLLPRHRGAAPIARSILAGDRHSGVTIMQMDAGLDTGDVLLQEKVNIEADDTAGTLHDKLAIVGSRLIVDYLNQFEQIVPQPQSDIGISYAHKIEKSEAKIDWSNEAVVIERHIRGFNPIPGCFTYLDDNLVKIWQAKVVDTDAALSAAVNGVIAGTVIKMGEEGIFVVCGSGTVLLILQLQAAGKNRQLVRDYVIGHGDLLGNIFS